MCIRDRTPGKRALGLRVVAGDGAPVGWLPAVVRNLMRTVDMLPFAYATGLVCLLYTSAAADAVHCVDLGGRRIIKKKNFFKQKTAYEM